MASAHPPLNYIDWDRERGWDIINLGDDWMGPRNLDMEKSVRIKATRRRQAEAMTAADIPPQAAATASPATTIPSATTVPPATMTPAIIGTPAAVIPSLSSKLTDPGGSITEEETRSEEEGNDRSIIEKRGNGSNEKEADLYH